MTESRVLASIVASLCAAVVESGAVRTAAAIKPRLMHFEFSTPSNVRGARNRPQGLKDRVHLAFTIRSAVRDRSGSKRYRHRRAVTRYSSIEGITIRCSIERISWLVRTV